MRRASRPKLAWCTSIAVAVLGGCNAEESPKPPPAPVVKSAPGPGPEPTVKEMKPPEARTTGDIAPLEPPGAAKDERADVKPR